GACSTMALSAILAALAVDGGYAGTTAAVTSSHFCAAEKQFRKPLEYGGQRPQTSQWTATGAGCLLFGSKGRPDAPRAARVLFGRIRDLGVTDENNMGAAMAPAAYDTLRAFFRETNTSPDDYDRVITGDLGELGHGIVRDFFARDGIDLGENFLDCGLLLYDRKGQDMHAGGSGCGCAASVFNGYLLDQLRRGVWRRIVFAPTGALLSPTSSFQGESVPGICHAVAVCAH
ncbi:MAG: stage V sporulation protein AD, partial [Oscillibacter sp.]|nr:stage V sporulation protein AD [Oscillibacter sp.]